MPRDTEAIAEQVFVALADPTRRGILAALASGGPATATDLADRLPITRQAIAKHLTLLTERDTTEPMHVIFGGTHAVWRGRGVVLRFCRQAG